LIYPQRNGVHFESNEWLAQCVSWAGGKKSAKSILDTDLVRRVRLDWINNAYLGETERRLGSINDNLNLRARRHVKIQIGVSGSELVFPPPWGFIALRLGFVCL